MTLPKNKGNRNQLLAGKNRNDYWKEGEAIGKLGKSSQLCNDGWKLDFRRHIM